MAELEKSEIVERYHRVMDFYDLMYADFDKAREESGCLCSANDTDERTIIFLDYASFLLGHTSAEDIKRVLDSHEKKLTEMVES